MESGDANDLLLFIVMESGDAKDLLLFGAEAGQCKLCFRTSHKGG